MPSKYDKYFGNIAFPVLKREFAEPIKYNLAGGGVRSIMAIIERSPPSIYVGDQIVTPSFIIRIDADCKTGLEADEVNTGGDTVDLIPELGGDQWQNTSVLVLMRQNAGRIQLALK